MREISARYLHCRRRCREGSANRPPEHGRRAAATRYRRVLQAHAPHGNCRSGETRSGRNVKREAGRGVSEAEREGWETGESGTDGASGREPPGRATRAPPAQTAHASRTNNRKHPRKDRINPPGRAAQGAKPHTLTPFQRETPPKWTKSEKFSLLLRENRQQTETRYGIQFQGD